jgi:3-deoxy-manno-octulosonate cytidylyltransferase (CMP-KDO synthetase)
MPSHPLPLVVIPARLASQRLPRKMLLADTGLPLVVHTLRAAAAAVPGATVVVVTDDAEIAGAVRAAGGRAEMTSPDAPSGTARIVEALPRLPAADVVVNLQGDEPEISPAAVGAAIALLGRCHSAGMATLVTPLRSAADLATPSIVKAVLTPWRDPPPPGLVPGAALPDAWRAITFSRAPVPAARDWTDDLLSASPPLYWQHVGLYAYRRRVLEAWDDLPPSRLAGLESLEQLRVVEAGIPIAAAAVDHPTRGIDTAADYAAFVARVRGAA